MISQYIEKTAIQDRVRQTLSEVFGQPIEKQYDQTLLRDIPDISYDSMTALECVSAIEQEFGVTIDMIEDDVMYNFQSVENIQAFVEKKLADNYALEQSFT
ncbi:acyl carrier protein [Nostoc sp. CHAB 5784]|uniref:acyl carrier protein n=1 Tax=Nostoc mirabile TaxID=2907820 RepID=UPI001E4C79D7|nr:acyl carrier protein [Nostoc mirabile]MCC5670643.1 acyl carrier protein [Nostoc mirabile CHAB5784]